MSDMRDRLAALVEEAEGMLNNDFPTPDMIADHLLANGVILPPCKVGDVLWDISEFVEGREHPEMYVLHADEISIDDGGYFVIDGCSLRYEDFGKTIFLTREEAEKAIKERNNNEKR